MFEEFTLGNRTYEVIPVVGICEETITDEEMIEKVRALGADNGEEEFVYVLEHAEELLGKGVNGKCFLFTQCVSIEHGDRFYSCIYKQPAHEKWLRHKATNKIWGKTYYVLRRVDRPMKNFNGQLGQ